MAAKEKPCLELWAFGLTPSKNWPLEIDAGLLFRCFESGKLLVDELCAFSVEESFLLEILLPFKLD